jgi:carbon-monoxide dehydrogenase large subunit
MTPLVGSPVERTEDLRFLTGRGEYVDDLVLEGMVHAAILRSPIAHARIETIDPSAALALPGVLAVYTFADIATLAKPIPIRLGPLPGFDRFLQFPLASDKVRYVGEPVALVVAQSAYVAEDALDLVAVAYEELPPVVDWEGALAGAGMLHEAAGTNVASSYAVGRGDAEAAFRDADYVRAETFRCHRHGAVPMETRGLLAAWDAQTGRLQVWGAAKVPFFNRAALAAMLDLPKSAIDLIEVDVGGGFGVRGEIYPEDFLVPFAARALGRPVKWIEDRREHLLSTNHSREITCELAIACRRDGEILGLRGRIMADIGAYVRTNGGVVPSKAAQFLPGPYRIGNFACEVNAHLSNKTPVGTYRGPGRFEANFFRERLMDMAAADLGIDPATFRRRNLVTAAELPYDIGKLVPHEDASAYDSGDFHATYERALTEIRWTERQAVQGRAIDGWYHGIGLACFVESGGAGPQENARLVVEPDGRVSIYVGSSNLGQGLETVFAQICGDALGVPMERLRVFHGSTTYLDAGWGTYHSRAVVMGGSAVLLGARSLIERMRPLAADLLGQPNQELVWDDGRFRTDDGKQQIDLAALAAAAARRGETLEAPASFSNTKRTYTSGAHAAYVAVDPRTGRVKLLDYVAVEDVGRMVNPLLVHGQAIGALVQGLGGAFLDEFIYGRDGQLLNASFADYLLPTADDFPNIRSVSLEIAPSATNPLGAKGAGEGGIVPVAAAIGNAVSAALAGLGVQVRELPLSPPRVWRLIEDAKQQRKGSHAD